MLVLVYQEIIYIYINRKTITIQFQINLQKPDLILPPKTTNCNGKKYMAQLIMLSEYLLRPEEVRKSHIPLNKV